MINLSRVVDVIVLGSGASGSGATLAATAAGASVALIEKRTIPGGSAALSAGGFWTFQDPQHYSRLTPQGESARQHKVHAEHHSAAKFIRRLGVPIADSPIPTGNKHGIGYKLDVHCLLERARQAAVDSAGVVLLGQDTVELLHDDDRIDGVVLQDRSGRRTTIHARGGVVLATGGWQGDKELRDRHLGGQTDRLLIRSNPGSTGDGFRLATAHGAAHTGAMDSFYGHLVPYPVDRFDPEDFRPLTQYHSSSSVLVDLNGRRLADETVGDSVLTRYVLHAVDGRGFLIFDDDVRHTEATDEPFPGVGVVDRFATAQRAGARTAEAGTIPDLVGRMAAWGVDPQQLAGTLAAHASAVRAGAPTAAGVPVGGDARTPQTPPFYALEVQPSVTFTFGGIRTSLSGEVIGRDGVVVTGLFAAGADAGGISGVGYAGGLAPCFITGSWAGGAAAHASGHQARPH